MRDGWEIERIHFPNNGSYVKFSFISLVVIIDLFAVDDTPLWKDKKQTFTMLQVLIAIYVNFLGWV